MDNVLSGNLCHPICAVTTAAADDAMSDICVVFASREANAERSMNAKSILSSNLPRPRCESLPVNFQRFCHRKSAKSRPEKRLLRTSSSFFDLGSGLHSA
jgi:hypothetical protein